MNIYKNFKNKFQKNKVGYLGDYGEIYDAVNKKIKFPLTKLELLANSKTNFKIRFLGGN